MSTRIEHLEQLRQGKQYRRVLNLISQDGIQDPIREIPIAIDSARGSIQREFLPRQIALVHRQLMNLGYQHLTNPDYVREVDQNPLSAISHRRDLSRYFGAVKPVVAPEDINIDQARFAFLGKADKQVAPENWHHDLLTIEKQNLLSQEARPVPVKDTINSLQQLLHHTEPNADRNAAVTTWALETALIQNNGVNDILQIAYGHPRISETVKILARAYFRLYQNLTRDDLVGILRVTLPLSDRKKIGRELKDISRFWF